MLTPHSVTLNSLTIRPIIKDDNHLLTDLIRTVMPEFKAQGEGFAYHDPSVESMYEFYSQKNCLYFVAYHHKKLVGGAGIAPLEERPQYAELQKMYIYSEFRGLGLGQKLLTKCLNYAKELNFSHCYLETLQSMTKANKLYQKNGFKQITSPRGNTGHHGCDTWYIKQL